MKAPDLVASERAWRGWQNTRASMPQHRFGNPAWEAKQRELVRRAMSHGLISISSPLLAPQVPAERPAAANVAQKNRLDRPKTSLDLERRKTRRVAVGSSTVLGDWSDY